MEFYPDKSKVLKITNKRKVIKYCYPLYNVILKGVSSVKYLGVTKNARLSYGKGMFMKYVVKLIKRDYFYKETL